jgi:hypothetical protein
MRMLSYALALGLVAALNLHAMASAGEASIQNDGSTTWQAGVDGIEIDWMPNGSVKRISSKYATPVEFADRRGIYKAQVIAEEKAKAAIIRFVKQNLTSTRVVAEIQSDINSATQQRASGGVPQITKTDSRSLAESLTEVTTSFASGALTGVIILEKGYDAQREEAWVVVGLSDKTIQAAQGVNTMTSPRSPSGGIRTQPGDVRRSNQKNW